MSYKHRVKISKKIDTNIYIKLLSEGTKVFRPVLASEIGSNIYKVNGFEMYDPEDEVWEFIPGTFVVVEEQNLDDAIVLVAIKEHKPI